MPVPTARHKYNVNVYGMIYIPVHAERHTKQQIERTGIPAGGRHIVHTWYRIGTETA